MPTKRDTWITGVGILSSLDSGGCYDVGAAVTAFEAFASQARDLNECSRCADSGKED